MAAHVCPVCGKKVKTTDKEVYCDEKCKRWFHAKCKNITDKRYKTLASDTNFTWTCDRDAYREPPKLKALQDSIAELSAKLENINGENQVLRGLFEQSTSEFRKDVDELMKLVPKVEGPLQASTSQKAEAIGEVNLSLEDDRQHSRLNNIKTTGIPEVPNEKQEGIFAAVLNLCASLGVQLTSGDINAAHRLPSSDRTKPRQIVVSFVTRWKKEAIIEQGRKQKRRLATKDAGFQEPAQPVYISEHLTKVK